MKGSLKRTRFFSYIICVVLTLVALTYSNQLSFTATADTMTEIEQKMKDNASEIKKLEESLKQNADNIEKNEEYQATLNSKISLQNDNLELINQQITDLSTNIEDLNASIEQTNLDIINKQVEIDDNIEKFRKRIRAMYISGNESVLTILAESKDFYDVLSKMELIKRVAKADNELIDTLNESIADMEQSKIELDNRKLQLEENMTSLDGKKSQFNDALLVLTADYNKTSQAIKELEQQEEEDKQSLEERKANQLAYEKEQAAIEAEIKRQQELLLQQQESIYVGGQFLWPVPNFYHISSYFGPRDLGTHYGIDISGAGIHGAPVVAANSGTVILVDGSCTHDYSKYYTCCKGYGKYVVVDHGGGYSTLYGHLASINVTVGQKVSKGQTLGGVGSTGFSTGNHLHYEIREGGTRVNPLKYYK